MVDLSLNATRLGTPAYLSADEQKELFRRAESQLDMSTAELVESQVLRVAVASALESRLLHTRQARLAAFSKANHPDWVTFAQLAALQRHHHGAAGQAFELAVADAVRAGDPTVVDPLIEGLALLNIPRPSTLNMIVTGLEKVRPEEAEGFYEALKTMCPDGSVLRTGLPGRPVSAQTALMRLRNATWANMNDRTVPAASRSESSQLGRADALVVADGAVVAVSLKVNRAGVAREPAWKDVPLWITTGPRRAAPAVNSAPSGGPPKVVVRLTSDRWVGAFKSALWVLDHAISMTDLNGVPRDAYQYWDWDHLDYSYYRRHAAHLTRWMVRHQDLTVSEMCQELRHIEHGAREILVPVLAAEPLRTDVRVLGAPPVIAGFEQTAADGRLVLGQPHLFFKPVSPLAS